MKSRFALVVFLLALAAAVTIKSDACSRIVYTGEDSLKIVGRSLDWRNPIPTNIYVYPAGMHKRGNTPAGSIEWTSRYGAVYAVGYDGGVTEGMNEKGLVINGLFCNSAIYSNAETEGRPPMSLAMFVAWLLDMNATTQEVVEVVKAHDFNISGATFDGGTVSTLHWGVTDPTGYTAVFEFVDGNINIYEGYDLPVLTNEPNFPEMNAINNYWTKIGGTHMLPGTVTSPDRFVRASFFDKHVKATGDAALGVAITRTLVENVSVPFDYTIEDQPHVSSTQWRSYANMRDKLYYFDVVTNPGVFYVDLKKINLRKGAPVLKIDTSKSDTYVGDATDKLFVTVPFTPMY